MRVERGVISTVIRQRRLIENKSKNNKRTDYTPSSE